MPLPSCVTDGSFGSKYTVPAKKNRIDTAKKNRTPNFIGLCLIYKTNSEKENHVVQSPPIFAETNIMHIDDTDHREYFVG